MVGWLAGCITYYDYYYYLLLSLAIIIGLHCHCHWLLLLHITLAITYWLTLLYVEQAYIIATHTLPLLAITVILAIINGYDIIVLAATLHTYYCYANIGHYICY